MRQGFKFFWRIDHTLGNDKIWGEHWYLKFSNCEYWNLQAAHRRKFFLCLFSLVLRKEFYPQHQCGSYKKVLIFVKSPTVRLKFTHTLKIGCNNVFHDLCKGGKQPKRLFSQSLFAVPIDCKSSRRTSNISVPFSRAFCERESFDWVISNSWSKFSVTERGFRKSIAKSKTLCFPFFIS